MRLDAIGIPSDKLLTCSTRARPRNSKEHKGGSEALPCGLDSGSWSRLARSGCGFEQLTASAPDSRWSQPYSALGWL